MSCDCNGFTGCVNGFHLDEGQPERIAAAEYCGECLEGACATAEKAGRAEAIAEIVEDLRALIDGAGTERQIFRALADRYERGEHVKKGGA